MGPLPHHNFKYAREVLDEVLAEAQAQAHDTDVVNMAYRSLRAVQDLALAQASKGKGKERHAVAGEAFEDQTMCEIARRLRGHAAGSLLYQVVKKTYESGRLPKERAIAELLGAMNYLAGAIIVMQELPDDDSEYKAKLTMP